MTGTKLAMATISLKSLAAFHLALSVLLGICVVGSAASGLQLVPRGYGDIDPRTMSCGIAFHQSKYQIESINYRIRDIYRLPWRKLLHTIFGRSVVTTSLGQCSCIMESELALTILSTPQAQ